MIFSFYRVCFTNRNQRISIIISILKTEFTGNHKRAKRLPQKIPQPSTDTEERTHAAEYGSRLNFCPLKPFIKTMTKVLT